jgi:hypothetical protein
LLAPGRQPRSESRIVFRISTGPTCIMVSIVKQGYTAALMHSRRKYWNVSFHVLWSTHWTWTHSSGTIVQHSIMNHATSLPRRRWSTFCQRHKDTRHPCSSWRGLQFERSGMCAYLCMRHVSLIWWVLLTVL